jgi:hypothetical protein
MDVRFAETYVVEANVRIAALEAAKQQRPP